MNRKPRISQAIHFLCEKHPFQFMILDYLELKIAMLFPNYTRKPEILHEDLKENELQKELIFQHYRSTLGKQSCARPIFYDVPFDDSQGLKGWTEECLAQENVWYTPVQFMLFSTVILLSFVTSLLLSLSIFMITKRMRKPIWKSFVPPISGFFSVCITLMFLLFFDCHVPKVRPSLMTTYEKKFTSIFQEREFILDMLR